MSKEKLNILVSTCVPLPLENIDTDQIIPARFLSATSREGFGENLFRDWRYKKTGEPESDFVLNDKRYSGKILVAGKNFGCGSSREHAVWAVYDYGFRVVVSSFFADIFRSNALNNGLLPVVIPEKSVQELLSLIKEEPGTKVGVNLSERIMKIDSTGETYAFEINQFKQQCLINGLDDIDYLISMKDKIKQFELNGGAWK
jgi:3-isopropylmalate/(R)-2-methylmalate dehydratase small subunit